MHELGRLRDDSIEPMNTIHYKYTTKCPFHTIAQYTIHALSLSLSLP
jgi:hypothetical protein